MLGRDTCGCLYLTADNGVVFCVSPCDYDGRDDGWSFTFGWRANSKHDAGVPRDLEPVVGNEAHIVFESWGNLIADGYAGREVTQALSRIRNNTNPKKDERHGD